MHSKFALVEFPVVSYVPKTVLPFPMTYSLAKTPGALIKVCALIPFSDDMFKDINAEISKQFDVHGKIKLIEDFHYQIGVNPLSIREFIGKIVSNLNKKWPGSRNSNFSIVPNYLDMVRYWNPNSWTPMTNWPQQFLNPQTVGLNKPKERLATLNILLYRLREDFSTLDKVATSNPDELLPRVRRLAQYPKSNMTNYELVEALMGSNAIKEQLSWIHNEHYGECTGAQGVKCSRCFIERMYEMESSAKFSVREGHKLWKIANKETVNV